MFISRKNKQSTSTQTWRVLL